MQEWWEQKGQNKEQSVERWVLAEVDWAFSIKSLCFKQMGFEAKEILGDAIEAEQIGELCLFDLIYWLFF